jgi:hypothetical protein
MKKMRARAWIGGVIDSLFLAIQRGTLEWQVEEKTSTGKSCPGKWLASSKKILSRIGCENSFAGGHEPPAIRWPQKRAAHPGRFLLLSVH